MVPEFYILRHGETEWNNAGRYQGWLDSPLTPKGEAQAQRMGAMLADRGVTPESHALRVSPSGRTQATARLAFPGAGHALDENLKEINMGSWGGLTRDDLRARGEIPDDISMLEFYANVPDGEGFGQLWDRAGAALDAISQPTILVTHGMTSRFLRARGTGMTIDRLSELDGGQGVIFHVHGGQIDKLLPSLN